MWRRRPAPPSRLAGGSEPSETLVWTGPAGPAAPQLAARDSARSVGCYLPANTGTGGVISYKSVQEGSVDRVNPGIAVGTLSFIKLELTDVLASRGQKDRI